MPYCQTLIGPRHEQKQGRPFGFIMDDGHRTINHEYAMPWPFLPDGTWNPAYMQEAEGQMLMDLYLNGQ